ncbi:hypothetical protein A2X44_01355 [candidate division CPR3 bacterium GWF2_35_18]|uniref:Helix-turn-helix domain protein n=1 Tax=candidate division CPR3 bacterium GW2011_GWF2_35_18 TaxID=1618350 RepID=A0A0G0C2L2_UNCC3|nr:MAG: Helix-turn-helix domain protein [candidate division CPR3 bacterium GW2011_GWF2_35_18]OGB63549.1 MAG: hypothetical protein A2X44_01355 [candidate division CPR3 bacterium GWF2_35_18]OGB64658.1 MAG: hypothetical protein A2250_03905 [candidate division CPR3 bacterium RIFOXYA2_FULL_35_13]OGB76541.1 MAG: hypothetical protein A2476_05385 [candidate division CPR3 bacterium RIFOXYC2_FULL_35_7]OGB78769.1 MAG: hypothetical protein A2296_00150 [candidate division CPR3 bacterium RIFOXYB2_FULL_35_8]
MFKEENVKQIGEKVQKFRISKGLTQQQLELEIGASNGHISKVESGQINPTKETLLKITKVLDLTDKQAMYLIGIQQDRVNSEEVKLAINETDSYLKLSKYPSFLEDDYLFIHNWNKKILNLFRVNSIFANMFKGRNMLEIMLQPQFKKAMKKERWETLFLNDLVFFMRYTNYELSKNTKVTTDLINYLTINYIEFHQYWIKAQEKYNNTNILSDNSIYFIKDVGEVCHYMSAINLVRYPRFRIVEYIPQNF